MNCPGSLVGSEDVPQSDGSAARPRKRVEDVTAGSIEVRDLDSQEPPGPEPRLPTSDKRIRGRPAKVFEHMVEPDLIDLLTGVPQGEKVGFQIRLGSLLDSVKLWREIDVQVAIQPDL